MKQEKAKLKQQKLKLENSKLELVDRKARKEAEKIQIENKERKQGGSPHDLKTDLEAEEVSTNRLNDVHIVADAFTGDDEAMPHKAFCFVQLGKDTDRLIKIPLEYINSRKNVAKKFLKQKYKLDEEPSILYHGNLSNTT